MLVLIFLVGTAQAWQVKTNASGHELGWEESTVPYVLNPAGDHGMDELAVELAVTAAAESWDRVPGIALSLDYEGHSSKRQAEYDDGGNLVYFEDDWSTLSDSLLAVTYVYSSTDTGEILEFDIAINVDYPWTTTSESDSYDLQNSLTHEFGHGLGLDHSKDGDATMYSSTYKGETDKRTLEVDDEQAARYLYGLEGWVEPAQIACSSTGSRSTGFVGLLAAFAGLALMRRRNGSDSRSDSLPE